MKKVFYGFIVASILAQLFILGVAHASCPQVVIADRCGTNCTWGYTPSTGENFPKASTIAAAQAAANAGHACTTSLVSVEGTIPVSAGNYENYFFEFTVQSNGQVLFNGTNDVSHDQNATPPPHCQVFGCEISGVPVNVNPPFTVDVYLNPA